MLKLAVAADDRSANITPRPQQWQITHSHLIVAATVLLTAITFACGERIPVGDGFGWDGQLYGSQAKDLFGYLGENPLDKYYVHRILPPALVHFGLRLTCAPRTNGSVIIGFAVLNVISA